MALAPSLLWKMRVPENEIEDAWHAGPKLWRIHFSVLECRSRQPFPSSSEMTDIRAIPLSFGPKHCTAGTIGGKIVALEGRNESAQGQRIWHNICREFATKFESDQARRSQAEYDRGREREERRHDHWHDHPWRLGPAHGLCLRPGFRRRTSRPAQIGTTSEWRSQLWLRPEAH